jgi:SAM-dependent methyltransferase
VLSHYFDTEHEIIDKYETAPGVRNIDILDLQTHKRYDLIVCVSTLEHVGWDELPRQPDKLLVAFEHLRSLLADGGILLITAPIGENQFLDECLRDRRLRFDRQHNYLRIGKTRWREAEWNEIKNAQHHHPFRFGNAVVIGEVRG